MVVSTPLRPRLIRICFGLYEVVGITLASWLDSIWRHSRKAKSGAGGFSTYLTSWNPSCKLSQISTSLYPPIPSQLSTSPTCTRKQTTDLSLSQSWSTGDPSLLHQYSRTSPISPILGTLFGLQTCQNKSLAPTEVTISDKRPGRRHSRMMPCSWSEYLPSGKKKLHRLRRLMAGYQRPSSSHFPKACSRNPWIAHSTLPQRMGRWYVGRCSRVTGSLLTEQCSIKLFNGPILQTTRESTRPPATPSIVLRSRRRRKV